MIIQREIYKKIKPYFKSPEAIVITGMRRVGKTTLLNLIFSNVDSKNKLMLDLENPIIQKSFEEKDYEKIKLNLEILGLDFSKKAFLFLDEIQYIKNLPTIVKYLYDHYEIKFFLTGSSSFYIKKWFTESLAGRKYIFELFPLSFNEFLSFKNSKLKLPAKNVKITKNIYNIFSTLYEEYVLYGGFPAVVLKESFKEKKMVLEDIFSSYFQLEIANLGEFRNINVVRDLIMLLMNRTGSKLDILKLSKELGISRPTIYEYISFLEGTYFIKLIRKFSQNKDTEIRSAPKFYICDSGLVNNLASISKGSLFENNVFQMLRVKGDLNYYQKKGSKEIDFILNKKEGYEVKLKPFDNDTKALISIGKELGLSKYSIVSKEYANLKNIKYGWTL